jgi:hypothetical protein
MGFVEGKIPQFLIFAPLMGPKARKTAVKSKKLENKRPTADILLDYLLPRLDKQLEMVTICSQACKKFMTG